MIKFCHLATLVAGEAKPSSGDEVSNGGDSGHYSINGHEHEDEDDDNDLEPPPSPAQYRYSLEQSFSRTVNQMLPILWNRSGYYAFNE